MSAQLLLDWAVQTGLAVSVLILFVLLIRKPVARYLGAGAAYALWVLPLIRIFLPAIPILPTNFSSKGAPPTLAPDVIETSLANELDLMKSRHTNAAMM